MNFWIGGSTFLFGATTLIVGGILGWIVFPDIIENTIIDNVKLKNNTEQYERWNELPFPVKFKVYLFHVLNPEEVLLGGKPRLEERGPYIYDQYRKKVDIVYNGDRLRYRQIQNFEFNATDSHPLLDTDKITVLNVPFHAIIQLAEAMSPSLVPILNTLQNMVFGNQGVILETTVEQLLFTGVPLCVRNTNVVCRTIAGFESKNMRITEDGTIYFSLFNHKNNSDDGVYTIDSGERNIENLGKIYRWEGSDRLSFWKNENDSVSICNMINGTDSSIYPPFINERPFVDIYSSDICRSVRSYYFGESTYMGIRGSMYVTTEDMLPAPSLEDETRCFCLGNTPGLLQDNGCVHKGAMELFTCMNSHTLLTYPHFLMADDIYQNGVEGLTPDNVNHQTFVLIEENTGSPLAGSKRVQFNMFMRRVPGMRATNALTTTLFPVVWLDEGIQLPDDIIEMLNDQLDLLSSALQIVEAVRWTLIAVGIVLVIVGVVLIVISMKRKTTV